MPSFLSHNLLSFDSVPGIQLLRVRQRLHGFQHGLEKVGQFPAQQFGTLSDDFPVAAGGKKKFLHFTFRPDVAADAVTVAADGVAHFLRRLDFRQKLRGFGAVFFRPLLEIQVDYSTSLGILGRKGAVALTTNKTAPNAKETGWQ